MKEYDCKLKKVADEEIINFLAKELWIAMDNSYDLTVSSGEFKQLELEMFKEGELNIGWLLADYKRTIKIQED